MLVGGDEGGNGVFWLFGPSTGFNLNQHEKLRTQAHCTHITACHSTENLMASLWNTCIAFSAIIWWFWLISKGFKLSFITRTPRWAVQFTSGVSSSNVGDRTPASAEFTLPISSDLFGGGRRWVITGMCPRLPGTGSGWASRNGEMWGRSEPTPNFLQTLVILAFISQMTKDTVSCEQ